MKSPIWLGLMLGLLAGHAGAANAPAGVPWVLSGAPCTSFPTCPVVPNDPTHQFYTSDTATQSTLTQLLVAIDAGITVNLNGVSTLTAQNTGNTTLANILSAMPAKNGDGGSLSHTTNGALETGGNLQAIATAQGTQGTGSTFNPPTGGSGILGYLSGIYRAVTGTLTFTVSGSGSGTDHSGSAPSALATLTTLTVSTPGAYRVQNQSAATLQVIMDNGTSGPTIILLGPGAGAGSQGADTSPELPWFTGRIQVAGPTGSQFAARSN